MAEFGHITVNLPGVHIDRWGAGPFRIYVVPNGKSFLFEDSKRFGPVPVNKNGEVRADGYFAENSMFWTPWNLWVAQGRRLEEDGKTCIWDNEV